MELFVEGNGYYTILATPNVTNHELYFLNLHFNFDKWFAEGTYYLAVTWDKGTYYLCTFFQCTKGLVNLLKCLMGVGRI